MGISSIISTILPRRRRRCLIRRRLRLRNRTSYFLDLREWARRSWRRRWPGFSRFLLACLTVRLSTQAGYIGEDAEVCVQRLLAAANYDVARAERGIICLDELDKIATAKVSHGKDVSGEGVQQALLKIIEGTTLQIQAKSERSAGPPPPTRGSTQQGYSPGGSPTNSPLSSGH